LISDEVELAKGDPFAWLLLLWFVAEVEDDSYLKHNISLNTKGPYLTRQLSDCFAPAISSNMIALTESNGSTQDTEIYTGSGCGAR
jgi:hypothetical protein